MQDTIAKRIIAELRYEANRWNNMAGMIRGGNENECQRRAALFTVAANLLEQSAGEQISLFPNTPPGRPPGGAGR